MASFQESPGKLSDEAMLRMKNLFIAGVFSDLIIICGEKHFKVHKNILWIQSEYFRKLLSGKFKEANATTLDLSADCPKVLGVLVHYLYFFELAETGAPSTPADSFLVDVYAIADKYDVPPLRNLAEARLRKIYTPKTWTPNVDAIIAVIEAVDQNTPDEVGSGRGLWAVLLPVIKLHMRELLKAEAFKDLLSDMQELNFALHVMPYGSSGVKEEPEDEASPTSRSRVDSSEYHPVRRHGRYGPGRTLGE